MNISDFNFTRIHIEGPTPYFGEEFLLAPSIIKTIAYKYVGLSPTPMFLYETVEEYRRYRSAHG